MLTGSLSRAGGGVFEIVRSLSLALAQRSVEVNAFGLRDEHTEIDATRWGVVETHACGVVGPQGLGYGPSLPAMLQAFRPDVVHLHGLWIHPSYLGYRWKRRGGKVHIITPQGMLEPWVMSHHRRRKWVAWNLFEREHLSRADCINVNSQTELQHLRALGIRTPICVVANGVDLPSEELTGLTTPWQDVWSPDSPVLLYLGRLHEKKGVWELIHAWAIARQGTCHDWRLAIVGWDQGGYGQRLQRRILQLGLEKEVQWFGPAFGLMKSAALRCARAFILPSFSEGLPMAVLEAWANKLPVLMTRACNLDVGFGSGAALEVTANPESIATGLRQLWEMPISDRESMGARGRTLVEERFTWPKIASDLHDVYAWCIGERATPPCVEVVN